MEADRIVFVSKISPIIETAFIKLLLSTCGEGTLFLLFFFFFNQ
jgi:hypothetical protein